MSTSPVHVWLIEDDPLYREAIVALIDGVGEIQVTAAYGTCEEALEALHDGEVPEVVLTDIGLPGMSGTEGARRIKQLSPASQIIMLTIHEDEDKIFDALCAGASGYLLKNADAERILQAIHEVRVGGVPFTAPIARKVLHLFREAVTPKQDYGLTDREKQILQHTAEGLTQRQVAEQLFLSPHTVDTHLRNIYAKLHVRNGLAAVSKAVRERLI
jgi:DNA-binding NarL/FixJ family response regulator